MLKCAAVSFVYNVLQALQNAKFVDHDSSGILCTPIQGREYGTKIQVHAFSLIREAKAAAEDTTSTTSSGSDTGTICVCVCGK